MGSPLNYFGAFGNLRGGWIQTDTGWTYPSATEAASSLHVPDKWLTPENAYVDESPNPAQNATTANDIDIQGFTKFRPEARPGLVNFGMNTTPGAVRFQTRGGIEVDGAGIVNDTSGCTLQAEVTNQAERWGGRDVW